MGTVQAVYGIGKSHTYCMYTHIYVYRLLLMNG